LPVPPPRGLTVPARNQAGAWLLTQSRAVEKLADVLEERAKELDVLGLGEFDFLPFEKQKEVQERFRDRWLKSTEGGFYAQEAWDKTRTKDAYNRTLESYYRKSQTRTMEAAYGSIACWRSAACRENSSKSSTRSSESAPRPAALPKQPPLPRPLRQRGAMFPEHSVSIRKANGVRHKRCKVYGLRTRCRQLDSQIQRQEYLWSHGRRHECMSRRRYNALLQEREEAWDAAEAESKKTGNPYKNRNKEMVKPPPKDMIGLVLRRYCDQNGLHYE